MEREKDRSLKELSLFTSNVLYCINLYIKMYCFIILNKENLIDK